MIGTLRIPHPPGNVPYGFVQPGETGEIHVLASNVRHADGTPVRGRLGRSAKHHAGAPPAAGDRRPAGRRRRTRRRPSRLTVEAQTAAPCPRLTGASPERSFTPGDGHPVAGARVEIEAVDDRGGATLAPADDGTVIDGTSSTTTDADDRFALVMPDRDARLYRVTARLSDRTIPRPLPPSLPPTATRPAPRST